MRRLSHNHTLRLAALAPLMCVAVSVLAADPGKVDRGSTHHFQTSDRCIACHNGMQTS
jgi:hypothetical protein